MVELTKEQIADLHQLQQFCTELKTDLAIIGAIASQYHHFPGRPAHGPRTISDEAKPAWPAFVRAAPYSAQRDEDQARAQIDAFNAGLNSIH